MKLIVSGQPRRSAAGFVETVDQPQQRLGLGAGFFRVRLDLR
jgi:hypothetical protein